MKNTGKEYELFVQTLMQQIINADGKEGQSNINVEHNKVLKDRNGSDRQFDIYWEYEIAGINYKTVIECKDYNSKVSVDKIDSLIGKLNDLPNIKGLFATTEGYQSGAKIKANANGIELLLINHLIRKVAGRIICLNQAKTLNFQANIDADWLKENTDIDPSKPLPKKKLLNNATFIDDIDNNEKYSLLDIEKALSGNFEEELLSEEKFSNAFIEYNDGTRWKISEYKIKYIIPKPVENKIDINSKSIYNAIVQYLNNDKKILIGENGEIKRL